jgi:hypothetical protein
MKHLQLYEEFNSENEGLKTWGAGLMAGLSLFANTAIGGDIKVKGTGTSSRMDIAIKKAESNARLQAMKQIGGDGSLSGTISNTSFEQPKITKDKEGNYVATIELSVDSSDVNVKKGAPGQIMAGEQAKSFIDDIIKMGYDGSEDIDEFIDKYSNDYDFKISKMTPEQADEVGEMSIKLSKTFKNGKTVFCVITPIGK